MTNYMPPQQPPPPASPLPVGYGQPGTQPGKRSNGWAIASLVCGIFGCVPWLTGVLATIFGIVGIRKARDPQVGGKGLAIAGLVLGLVSIVLWSVFGGAIIALVLGTSEQREIARQFVNDLAAGNLAAAQAHCAPGITAEQVQAAIDAFAQWGTLRDTRIIGVQAGATLAAGASTEVRGVLQFDNATVEYQATLVKRGDSYQITQFSFQPMR